jgi:hypothetical protein
LILADPSPPVLGTTRTVALQFRASNPDTIVLESAAIKAGITPTAGITVPQAYLSFHTADNTVGYQERARITPDGKLGIGTSSPEEKLHIAPGGKLKIGSQIIADQQGSYYAP